MHWEKILETVVEIAPLMTAKGWQLATAESCTGGLIAAALTEMAGASDWFERGFVTYTNQAKQEMLSVPEILLERHGAVSEEVACAMAEGALGHSSADIAVAVTGIAGPGGARPEKPVGTVYIALCQRNAKAFCQKQLYSGDRHQIRLSTCHSALHGILQLIKAG